MIEIHLYKLPPEDKKKYKAVLHKDGKKYKTVRFGQGGGASDYTIHKDPERKQRYIARHQVRENWKDITKPGTWSRYILWNKPTLKASIKNMEKVFKVKIIMKS